MSDVVSNRTDMKWGSLGTFFNAEVKFKRASSLIACHERDVL